MSNLVSSICLSLQILGKGQIGVFPISGFLVNLLINKKCQNSRTSGDIDTKLGPKTKLDEWITTMLKINDDLMSANYDVIVIYG